MPAMAGTSVCRPYHSSPGATVTGVFATAASTQSMCRQSLSGMSSMAAHFSTHGFHTTTSGKPSCAMPRLRFAAFSSSGRLAPK